MQPSPCFRQAILEANAAPNDPAGPDQIHFSIEGAGTHVIRPLTDLPEIVERFHQNSVDDLYVAIGNGELTAGQVINAIARKKAAEVEKGSGEPNRMKVGQVTRAQVKEIAELKMKDLNASSVSSAMRQVEGTARSMGIQVVD